MLKPLLMSTKRLLGVFSSFMLCVLVTQFSFGQTKTITGKVTDDKGSPVQGATVTIKGSRTGTATDAAGAFKLSVSGNAKTLVISSVGFASTEASIADKTDISVALVPSNTNLNEVVVTGYGTARKKDLTGAVASISAKDFSAGVTTPLEGIEGKVAGLVITSPGGDPNGSLIVHLRGQASLTGGQSPLIVLDGVPLDNPNQLSNIPPNDIASMDVLKDASAAAIYGTRAANGVIIVNTKKGHAGKTTIEYNAFVGVDKQAKYYPLLGLADWKTGSHDYLITQTDPNTGVLYTPTAADAVVASYDHGGNTDWQKAITRTAYTQNHNIAISGGTGSFTYRGSVSYLDQQGVVINSDKTGIGLRFNAEQKALNDKLVVTLGVVNTSYTRKYTDYSNFTFVFFNPPSYPVYNKDGSFYAFSDFAEANPVEHLTQELNQRKRIPYSITRYSHLRYYPGIESGCSWFYIAF